jgi:hypothetical protein
MKYIGAHMGYTILWGRGAKDLLTGVLVCFYPAALPHHMMAVLSGARVVRVLCVWVAAPCCQAACECVGVAAECERCQFMALGSASTKRFLFVIIPKRRNCAKSVSKTNSNLNMR